MIGFIVNPVSGNGRGEKVWKKLKAELNSQRIDYQARVTTKMGEARLLTRELMKQENMEKIVAVGGDGTVNEVINGMLDAGASCRFGHIPAGSGNDFARAHMIPREPISAWKRIRDGEGEKTIDLLRMNQRIAVNAVGAGIDGLIAKTANESFYKKICNWIKLGVLAYIISVIRVLFTYQPSDVLLQIDGVAYKQQRVWMITVSNIANYGGGMLISPHAISDDGIAEICVIKSESRWELLKAFPKIFTGAHVNHPAVQFYRGQKITVTSDSRLLAHADGEVVAETPIQVELLPKMLRVITHE